MFPLLVHLVFYVLYRIGILKFHHDIEKKEAVASEKTNTQTLKDFKYLVSNIKDVTQPASTVPCITGATPAK